MSYQRGLGKHTPRVSGLRRAGKRTQKPTSVSVQVSKKLVQKNHLILNGLINQHRFCAVSRFIEEDAGPKEIASCSKSLISNRELTGETVAS